MKPANILLISASNHRADCFGFEGRRVATPHLDRLAHSGTRFSTCISPSHVGQPARASILTGKLPLTHGIVDNGVDLSDELAQAGFGCRLSAAGYRTALIGKAHFSTRNTFAPTGQPECRSSGHLYDDDWTGPYAGFDYVELVQGHLSRQRKPLCPPDGLHYERWLATRGQNREAHTLWAQALCPITTAAQTWHSALPPAWHSSTWTADRSIAFIRSVLTEQPFCLWMSFADPHFPYDCPVPWSQLHSSHDVDLPAHRAKDFDSRPWWHRASQQNEPRLDDPALKKSAAQGMRIADQTDAELADMIANYYGMLSLIDHNVGRVLEELDLRGFLDNTLIIYTSDSSDLLGDHGLNLKVPVAYEGMLRMPLILNGPGVPIGHVVDDPVSTMDIAATLFDLAGVEGSPDIQSCSILPLLDPNEPRRICAYSEWNLSAARCGVALQLRTVRTRSHKLMIELGSGGGEMYDLNSDPSEQRNLFGDPAHSDVQEMLEALIAARPGALLDRFPEPVGLA